MAIITTGQNPKPPVTLPVVPFSATPTDWTRTEFSTAGDFAFTPAENTTLVLAIVQGGGAGGQILQNLDGTYTTYGADNIGKDSYIATPANDIITLAGGGNGILGGEIGHLNSAIACDWVRYQDTAGAARPDALAPSNAAAIGTVLGRVGGVGGLTYTIAALTGPNLSNVDFTNASSEILLPVNSTNNWTRNGTLGWFSTNVGMNGTQSSVEFKPINLAAGQTVTIAYNVSSETSDVFRLLVNGNVYVNNGGSTNTTFTFNAGATGNYVFRFEYNKNASGQGGLDRAAVTSFKVTNGQFPRNRGGATGANLITYLLPTALNIRVGAGGLGVSGGQTVPAGANATRGNGGAGGGKGGDGVVIIYEYSGALLLEPAPYPLQQTTYDVALTTEKPGYYRTNYMGDVAMSATAYQHTVRPRTKNVLVLMCGAGGGAIGGGDVSGNRYQPADTLLTLGPLTYTAGSGNASTRGNSGEYILPRNVGENGQFTAAADRDEIFSKPGASISYSTATAFVTGSYGRGGSGYSDNNTSVASWYAGGTGAVGMFIISQSELEAFGRTLNLQLPGGGYGNKVSGVAGAMFIYETETSFGPQTTQNLESFLIKDGLPSSNVSNVVESILRKDGFGDSVTSQTAELILNKDGFVGDNITQSVEMMLVKESDAVDLQVSYMNVAFVLEGEDPKTAVSQSVQQVLMVSPNTDRQITQSAEMILMKSEKLPLRISHAVELMFVAENPSVLWLNFGTLEFPVKNKLYQSSTGRATSVQSGAYLQLEGLFAPGTTMFVNGVDVGLSSPLQNNDSVYIYGGVANYYQTFINAYVYYTKNGQIARELAGTWKIVQPNLTAVSPRSYAAYTNFTWMKTAHKIATSSLVPTVVKSNTTYGKFVEVLAQKVSHSASNLTGAVVNAAVNMFSFTNAVVAKANTKTSGLLIDFSKAGTSVASTEPEFTKANTLLSEITVDWELVKVKDVYSSLVSEQAVAAHVVFVDSTYEETHAGYGDFIVAEDGFDLIQVSDGSFIIVDSDLAHAGFGDMVKVEIENTPVPHMELISQEFIESDTDHANFSDAMYRAISSSGYGSIFSMTSFSTIAYSVLSNTQYQYHTGIGTGVWQMPVGDALFAKAGFATVDVFAELTKAHPELVNRGTFKEGAHDVGYFSAYGIVHSVGIELFEISAIKTVAGFADVGAVNTPLKTSINSAPVNLTPYRYVQSLNGRGKASLYMGFDTVQDALDYTANLYGVTTFAQYNGFVYNLEIDKSFVCEVYFNGPVSGLIQGG